jgi:hypothetical protein
MLEKSEQNKIRDYLLLPVEYLLQEFEKEDLVKAQDDWGWGFMHWAVANNDYIKIKELLEVGFNFNLLSNNVFLPPYFFNILNGISGNTIETQKNGKFRFISFSSGGISPAHLSIALYNQYSTLAEITQKGKFGFDSLKKDQLNIIEIFTKNNFEIEDGSGFSVSDYCFMFENMDCIEHILKVDPQFESLRKIKYETAKRILISYKKYKYKKDLFSEEVIDNIIKNLTINEEFMKLNKTVIFNNVDQLKSVEKI